MRQFEKQRLSPAFFVDVPIVSFKRSGLYHLSEEGRWGPRWLHKLLLKAARNLGMLRNEVIRDERSEVVRVETIDYNADVESQISDALISWIDRDWDVEDLEIVCGERWFTEFSKTLKGPIGFEYPVNVSRRKGDRIVHWRGVRMRIVPSLEGWAILPLS